MKSYKNFIKLLLKHREIQFPEVSFSVRSVRDSVKMPIKLSQKSRGNLQSELNGSNIPIGDFGDQNNSNARLYQNSSFLKNRNHILANTKKSLSEVFDLRSPIHSQSKEINLIA